MTATGRLRVTPDRRFALPKAVEFPQIGGNDHLCFSVVHASVVKAGRSD
jgi:hypothetical protein